MAGDEGGVAAHRPKPLGNRIEQILVIAAREIGAADRALEQDVADDRQLRFGMVEDDMARRVAGAVADVEGQVADRHRIAVDQPAVGHERLAGHAIFGAIFGQAVDPEQIVDVRALDLEAELGGEDAGRSAMVDMAVGKQDFLERHAVLRDCRLQFVEIPARIDQRALHRRGAPDQAAILLQRGHRDDRGAERGRVGHGPCAYGAAG